MHQAAIGTGGDDGPDSRSIGQMDEVFDRRVEFPKMRQLLFAKLTKVMKLRQPPLGSQALEKFR